MNRIYRSIWNQKTGTFIAASEIAQSHGGRASSVTGAVEGLAMLLMLAFGSNAFALPEGGVVSAGQADIASGIGGMTINQSSQNAAINWQSFSIGAGEAVYFNQPNSSAITLNRVLGSDPSNILGSLSANGNVFLVNPNGVMFGQGAQINVGGLVASTLNITDSDFMAGRFKFSGTGNSVINQGTITAANGGYVALLGANVSNEGVITAKLGTVALAAGEAVTLDVAGDGLLNVAVDQGAVNALAENGGLIQADGGQVLMTAQAAGDLLDSAVNNTGIIQAQTIENRNGTIKLLGDMDSGTVNVGGTLDASAPAQAEGLGAEGNGGFIETSAAHVKIAGNAKITTRAENGQTGSWLIDPQDYTIAASGGDITGAQLSANLGSSNITILSTSGASAGNGDINVNDAVSWSANRLTLNAQRNININTAMNATGTAQLALEYGQGAVAAGNTSTYNVHAPINLASTSGFSTKLGSDGGVKNYTVITALGSEGSATATDLQGMSGNLTGNYVLGANIDAAATGAWNGNAGFEPIGNGAFSFTGTFDGLGHAISNLSINRPGSNFVGLFGKADGAIRNIGLIAGSVTGNFNVGVLVGYNNSGSISTSYATGSLTGQDYVGGLVGYNNSGSISTSYATGSVTGIEFLGGLVGYNNSGSISNSYATGAVEGNHSRVGGLVGFHNSGSISNSYATGMATAGGYVGGLVGGKNDSASISNTYYNASVNGSLTGIGTEGSMNDGTDSSSGIVDSVGVVTGLTTEAMKQQASFTPQGNAPGQWDFANTWVMYDTYTTPLLRSFMTPLTITANGTTTYNGTAVSGLSGLTYSIASPNLSHVLGTATYSNSGMINAGSYANTSVSGLISDQQGYIISYGPAATVTVAPKALTVAGMTAADKVYDGNTTATLSGGSLSGLIGIETLAFSGQSGAFADANAGTAKAITVTGITLANGSGLASNYSITNPTGLSANITPKALTVTGISASDKVYDGNTSATLIGGTLSGLIGSETLGFSGQSGVFADKNAGTAKAVSVSGIALIDGSGLASNYSITNPTGLSANITPKALTLTGISAADKVYDGSTTASLSGGALSGLVGSETLGFSGQSGVFADKNAGTAKAVTVAGITLIDGSGLASNYSITNPTGLSANITPKALTLTGISAADKVYDGSTTASLSGGALSGLVGSETLGFSGQTGAFADADAGTDKAVAVTGITLTDGSGLASNYSIANPTGLTADITALPSSTDTTGAQSAIASAISTSANLPSPDNSAGSSSCANASTPSGSSANTGSAPAGEYAPSPKSCDPAGVNFTALDVGG